MTSGMERADPGVACAGRRRWAAVGRSAQSDAATAGLEAARAALDGHDDDPGLLLVFASGAYDLPLLIEAIAEVSVGVPLVGCTSAGEIAADGPTQRSVVVLALGGDGLAFSVAAVTGVAPRDAGARVAACVGDVAERPHRVLMLLADGPSAIHADIVRGAYSVSGAGVPLVGGIAGHPRFGPNVEHSVVYGGSVLHDAVVGVAIGSDAPLGIGVRHGWRESGEPLLVTRAEPGRVLELDGRPAGEVYRELLGGGDRPDAVVLGHPLGMQQRVGEAHIRSVARDDDGALRCAAPAGALVWLMRAEVGSVLDAADGACADAVGALDGAPPTALLTFGCAARFQFLGGLDGRACEEITAAARHAGDGVFAGLYTHGEIARTRGITGYHHQTFVALAVG
jgi:hypothetical protein